MSRVHRIGVLAGPRGGGGGQQLFTANGTFVVPAGVTSICAVAIGAGYRATGDGTFSYGGGGGALSYANAVTVTPGESIAITVNSSTSRASRAGTPFVGSDAATGRNGAVVTHGTGFSGGTGGYNSFGSSPITGGGAGGYTSAGGSSGFGAGTSLGGGGSSPLGGGAGGAAGGAPTEDGGTYGGGSGAVSSGLNGGPGCVRIIWGAGRAFPNTNTGDV